MAPQTATTKVCVYRFAPLVVCCIILLAYFERSLNVTCELSVCLSLQMMNQVVQRGTEEYRQRSFSNRATWADLLVFQS